MERVSPPFVQGPVLVRTPNWLGDLIMATPVLEALARAFPRALTLAVRSWAGDILAGLACSADLLPAGRPRSPGALAREVSRLRQRSFRAALVLPNSLESALLPWLAGIPVRAGTLTGRSWLLTHGFREPARRRVVHKEPRRIPRYMGDLYADLAALLGVEVKDLRPCLAVTPAEERQHATWLSRLGLQGESYFLLNPGAAYGAAKLWPPERMARTGSLLHRTRGWRGIVLSGPARAEQEMARGIAGQGEGLVAAVGADLVRLGPLKPLVRDSALMVTTDSGPRQVAAAFQVPLVVLMGPTDPRFTHRHLERARVLSHPVPCGPCHLRVCAEGHHRCLEEISPEMVLQAVEELTPGSP